MVTLKANINALFQKFLQAFDLKFVKVVTIKNLTIISISKFGEKTL